MGARLIDDFIRDILSVPFYPYHFVRTILSNTILSVYRFVHTILSDTILSGHPIYLWYSMRFISMQSDWWVLDVIVRDDEYNNNIRLFTTKRGLTKVPLVIVKSVYWEVQDPVWWWKSVGWSQTPCHQISTSAWPLQSRTTQCQSILNINQEVITHQRSTVALSIKDHQSYQSQVSSLIN